MTEASSSESWNKVEVDLDSLRSNYRSIRKLAETNVKVMAVVKSDAYGHGMVEVAQALSLEGASVFGVAETKEGVRLRRAGIKGDVVILLGAQSENFDDLFNNDLIPVVYDAQVLKGLSQYGEEHGKKISIHLKIDTGMGRIGVMPDKLPDFLDLLESLKGVQLTGVLSHFPKADSDPVATDDQGSDFAGIIEGVRGRFGDNISHISNSAAIINNPGCHMDMVRPGIALYGYCPSSKESFCSGLSLRPVMSFKTKIIQVKEVSAGTGISYGHIYTTTRPTRIAVLPVGYDDGYLRKLSGKAQVLIGGRKVPILGRICMNACMADITDLERVKVGDEVVLLGWQGQEEISADEIASWLDTISYEVLCVFGGSNQRIYT